MQEEEKRKQDEAKRQEEAKRKQEEEAKRKQEEEAKHKLEKEAKHKQEEQRKTDPKLHSEGAVDEAVDEARKSDGRPLNQSRCQFVGQGRSGKSASGRAMSGLPFIETDSTIGVSQSMLEVDKINLDVRSCG